MLFLRRCKKTGGQIVPAEEYDSLNLETLLIALHLLVIILLSTEPAALGFGRIFVPHVGAASDFQAFGG